MVGASAGVYAILTANLANMVLNWGDLEIIDKATRLFAFIAFMGIDIGMTFFHKELTIVAHLGGALAGLLLGVLVLKNWHIKRSELICQLVCVLLFIGITTTCMVLIFMNREEHAEVAEKADKIVKAMMG